MLPRILQKYLETVHNLNIKSAVLLDGGCINHALRLDSEDRTYCLKWNGEASPGTFSCEARGLALISASQTIRVPRVFGFGDPSGNGIPGYILMEWIEPPDQKSLSMAMLGEQLARLHLNPTKSSQQFGLDYDNFIGSSVQVNAWSENWSTFFRDQRLGVQINMALRKGHLSMDRRRRLDTLLTHLDTLLPARIDLRPSLLHGDLWSGNVIPGQTGEPVLIDPAVYYGDREAEIAYTELFGGFDTEFYQAYKSVYPLDPGYKDRRDLYNLYHLLNHLNIFGESYGPMVDQILKHYTI